jgi:hypothetical protein
VPNIPRVLGMFPDAAINKVDDSKNVARIPCGPVTYNCLSQQAGSGLSSHEDHFHSVETHSHAMLEKAFENLNTLAGRSKRADELCERRLRSLLCWLHTQPCVLTQLVLMVQMLGQDTCRQTF